MPRKRYSAFEDFPITPEQSEEKAAPPPPFQDSPHILTQPEVPNVERIERLRPTQMIPDRFQPRRLLPSSLRPAFFSGKIDCYQAASQWLEMAKSDSGMQDQINRLLAMGSSFEEHGQIKPITGSWVPTMDGSFIFQIETGERRFWAACLQVADKNLPEEPLLRVEVIDKPTRQRQVLENQHAEIPSAVGRACEAAALILSELGIAPEPNTKDEFDYFRKADQARANRMPTGFWQKITPIMGGVSRPRLLQLLDILKLPTPLLEAADRHRVPERVLREILNAPHNHWPALLDEAIRGNKTSDDIASEVAEITQKPRSTRGSRRSGANPPNPAQSAINAMKRFLAHMEELDETFQSDILDELANDLVLNGKAEGLMILMQDLSERILIRQQNLQKSQNRRRY